VNNRQNTVLSIFLRFVEVPSLPPRNTFCKG
jgi:hypothetical protein